GAGARVDGSTVLENATVEPNAVITDSLVGAGAVIGARTVLAGAVIGDGARVGADNELRDGIRIWCGSTLPDASVRFSSDQ
ncbi:mannose-1-phosphate guanylyltransferase, partial [Streptomyces sp. Termitarium-T10T-6]